MNVPAAATMENLPALPAVRSWTYCSGKKSTTASWLSPVISAAPCSAPVVWCGLIRLPLRPGWLPATIIEKQFGHKAAPVTTDYTGIGKLQYLVAQNQVFTLDTHYTDSCYPGSDGSGGEICKDFCALRSRKPPAGSAHHGFRRFGGIRRC